MPSNNTFSTGPYIPSTDIPPIWNDIYYGNTITVNGNTWPNLNVEPRRYRFRMLNGCAVRPLTLKVASSLTAATPAAAALPIWVIGSDGGFLPHPVELSGTTGLPVLPSERYDVIIDFTGVKPGTKLLPDQRGRRRDRGHHRDGHAVHRGAAEVQGQVHPARAPDAADLRRARARPR